MGRDVIVACDFSGRKETLEFLGELEGLNPFIKIGMELFYREGPQMVRELKEKGYRIFLDLKLHDIPNTVEKAMTALASLNVDMCNIHAAGGRTMMEAALRGLGSGVGKRPLLIAVTQLTSTSQEQMERELLIERPMKEVVASYGRNALKAGLDGVVCSPLEAPGVHEMCGKGFLTVTPGVRFAGDSKGDQKRVTDPAGAAALGSDYIVVGRSITGASHPRKAYERCIADFTGLKDR